ncbi:MAG: single-stranded DNA-binding protein [Actinomycetaceae bacterium]|nr:single-stranded DNA-binding protein [Actinomycetaceae bacterium]
MFNATQVTVSGFAGADAQTFEARDGAPDMTLVSVGVTARRFNRENREWESDTTMWYQVRSYGSLARNVAATIKKGMPVLVRGRFTRREWTDDEGNAKQSDVIIADALGIELATGTATFTKNGEIQAEEQPAPLPDYPNEWDEQY